MGIYKDLSVTACWIIAYCYRLKVECFTCMTLGLYARAMAIPFLLWDVLVIMTKTRSLWWECKAIKSYWKIGIYY